VSPAPRLTETQKFLIRRYARSLLPADRDVFRAEVLDRLRGEPSVAAVEAAIAATLARRRFIFTSNRGD
jgi:hypothetical protein